MKRGKIAWVLPGGGNQTAYTCGVCFALNNMKIKPNFIVASSGGAANAFYFVAGQIKRAKEIWTNEISSKSILSLCRFWKMFNRDKMIDGVFMENPERLRLNNVGKSQIKVYVAVTDKQTGNIKYFTNHDRDVNLLSLLKATLTVPFFSGILSDNSILIKNKRYTDTRATARYEILVKKAIREGADKIILIEGHRSWNYKYLGNFLHDLWLYTKNKTFRENQKKLEYEQRNFSFPKNVKVLDVGPKKSLNLPPWSNEKLQLKSAVKKGYQETIKCSKIIKGFVK